MRVMVFFSLQPIDAGGSTSDEIARSVQILREHGLETDVGPTGTTIFGEFGKVMDAIEECHEELARDGKRVNSELMIDAKPGMEPGDMQGRVDRVMEQIEGPPAL